MALQPELTPIVPNSDVYILRGVPLDNTYANTIIFKTPAEQQSYFKSKAKFERENFSPVRIGTKIRFNRNASSLMDCNYLMFKNTEFTDKWFYAFITDVEYINVNMCEITYEIDVMQSWWFNITFKDSFIERCHVSDDTIGQNTEPEGLELGTFIINKTWTAPYFDANVDSNWGIGVLCTYTGSGAPAFGQIWANVYSGLNLVVFNLTQVQDLNAWLTRLNDEGKLDGVVAIYMVPTKFYVNSASVASYVAGIPANFDTLDGYRPQNNKLYCYPYNFLYVSNSAGNGNTLHWEKFIRDSDGYINYEVSGDVFPSASFMWAPKFYKSTDSVNVNEALTLTGLPQCAWIGDTYRAWLAQNQSSLNLGTAMAGLQTIGGIAGVVAGTMTGNVGVAATGAGLLSTGASGVAGLLAKKTDSQASPESARGNQVNNIMYATGNFGFKMYCMSINHEIAKTIDDYFSMFGYAVNRVMTPNPKHRKNWDYIKTRGCNLTGNICFQHTAKIKSIMDNGITFWHDSDVGNYSRSNPIV